MSMRDTSQAIQMLRILRDGLNSGKPKERPSLSIALILVTLARDGTMRMKGVLELCGISRPGATKLCDELVRKELVERFREEGDRRKVFLRLSDRGRNLVQKATANHESP